MVVSHHKTSGLGAQSPEATLFAQAQAGCAESLNLLMECHDGLVQAVVRRQVLGELPFDEALQAGRMGLWRAILGFDPSRGVAFSTYAWPCIMHQVWRAVKEHTRFFSSPTVRAGLLRREAPDPALVYEEMAIRRALYRLLLRLSPRLAYVLFARYGLAGYPPHLYRQIGAALGLSAERARQLHTEALVWLRHPAHSYDLRSLLGRHTLSDYEWADEEARRWLHRRGGRHA